MTSQRVNEARPRALRAQSRRTKAMDIKATARWVLSPGIRKQWDSYDIYIFTFNNTLNAYWAKTIRKFRNDYMDKTHKSCILFRVASHFQLQLMNHPSDTVRLFTSFPEPYWSYHSWAMSGKLGTSWSAFSCSDETLNKSNSGKNTFIWLTAHYQGKPWWEPGGRNRIRDRVGTLLTGLLSYLHSPGLSFQGWHYLQWARPSYINWQFRRCPTHIC